MKYTKDAIASRLDDIVYGDTREENRKMRIVRKFFLFICLLSAFCVLACGIGMFKGIIDNAPDINSLSFTPSGYASKAYDNEGNLIATLVQEGSNREEASYDELPSDLINAFVAIEDQRFWEHNGIDLRSITRAVMGVLTNNDAGGGSTITQQLIKNNVLKGGNEDGFALYERKFQEWYIALILENQPGADKIETKKGIITDYLNTINLGNNTLGVKVAAQRYFGKSVSELNLSECAVLASIPKSPTKYNPIRNPENNKKRRAQVLKNMLDQEYIDEQQYNNALNDNVYERIKNVNDAQNKENTVYSYFTDELIEQCIEAFKTYLGMTEAEAKNLLYSGGLRIESTQDPKLQAIVDKEVNNPDNYDTAKYSFKWRFSVKNADKSITHYSEIDIEKYLKEVKGIETDGLYKSEDRIKEIIEDYKNYLLKDGDEILGENIDTTLQPQVSFVLMDQHTKEVKAIAGGRGEKKYSRTLNRATNTKKQPGSTFKVISSFAPAIEENGATLSTVYYDAEYIMGTKKFRNWWRDGEYFGYSSIRDGIEYSMNIVAVRCLMETVTPAEGIEFARKLGITTLSENDENPALALGGLYEGVTNLELTNAFAAIGDGGLYGEPKFFTKIYDHDGNCIIDFTEIEKERVMKETTAFLLTDAMRRSMISHSKWAEGYTVNNTSSRAAMDNMTAAGKSGTTTKNNDIWFVGYTPYYTAGIWGGCDDNQSLYDAASGQYNGGTSFHKNIWRKIMTKVHEGLENKEFEKPDDIVSISVCRKSGKLPQQGCYLDVRGGSSAVYEEYFDIENVPDTICDHHTEFGQVVLPDGEENKVTDDSSYVPPVPETESESESETENIIISPMGPGEGNVVYDDRFNRPERGPGVGL